MEFILTVGFNPETLQRIDAFLKAINAEQPAPTEKANRVNRVSAVAAPAETAKEKSNGTAPVITLEDLRKLTKDKSDKSKENKQKVKELIAEFAGSVSDIPEDKYPEYHNKLIQL